MPAKFKFVFEKNWNVEYGILLRQIQTFGFHLIESGNLQIQYKFFLERHSRYFFSLFVFKGDRVKILQIIQGASVGVYWYQRENWKIWWWLGEREKYFLVKFYDGRVKSRLNKKPSPFQPLLFSFQSMWIINLWAIRGKNWNKLSSGNLSSSEHLQRDLNGNMGSFHSKD